MNYSVEELSGALKAFNSSINKCEKTKLKLKEGSWQMMFINRQLSAFNISVALIESLRKNGQAAFENLNSIYTNDILNTAVDTLRLLIDKCEGMKSKIKLNSPQMTLLLRREKAFNIALSLIG